MRLLIVGAGGHAKVVLDAARRCGFEIAGVIGEPGRATELCGVPVTHEAAEVAADGFIAAIGDNTARAREYERMCAAGLTPVSVLHPSAIIAESVVIEPGVFAAAGAIVNIDARIGENAIINTGCTVDHDCTVGAHALIGPTASLCGGVMVGEGALVGAGASLIPGVSVGEWSVVGAGSAVTGNVPARSVYAGVPARCIRSAEGRQ